MAKPGKKPKSRLSESEDYQPPPQLTPEGASVKFAVEDYLRKASSGLQVRSKEDPGDIPHWNTQGERLASLGGVPVQYFVRAVLDERMRDIAFRAKPAHLLGPTSVRIFIRTLKVRGCDDWVTDDGRLCPAVIPELHKLVFGETKKDEAAGVDVQGSVAEDRQAVEGDLWMVNTALLQACGTIQPTADNVTEYLMQEPCILPAHAVFALCLNNRRVAEKFRDKARAYLAENSWWLATFKQLVGPQLHAQLKLQIGKL